MEGAGKLIDDEELREAMSERGLGTPATRAQVIEGLLFEGYLLRQGRDLFVTAKGLSLITLLKNLHAESLTKPELTGGWEYQLRQMERGQLSREKFMGEIRTLTTDLVEKVRGGMGKEIMGHFEPLAVTCPKVRQRHLQGNFPRLRMHQRGVQAPHLEKNGRPGIRARGSGQAPHRKNASGRSRASAINSAGRSARS